MSRADPTRQARNRNKAKRLVTKRLRTAKKEVIRLFEAIPRQRRNVPDIATNTISYEYQLTPEEKQALTVAIASVLVAELADGGQSIPAYIEPVIESAHRSGAISETNNFNRQLQLAEAAGVTVGGVFISQFDIQQTLQSSNYLDGLRLARVTTLQQLKGIADKAANQVTKRILDGVAAEATPTDIKAEVRARFDVAESDIARETATGINKVYNDAALATVALLTRLSGHKTAVLHRSALMTTTRATHAARHGFVYTRQQQNQWWARDGNRFNCFCTIQSVILNDAGNVIDSETQQRIIADGVKVFG